MKNKLIKYVTSFLAGGGLFCLYLFTREFPVSETAENYHMLSDAATIPGLLFIMFGALVWASSLGAMDGFSYGLSHLFRALIPGARNDKEETYAEYLERRREKYGKAKGYGFLLVTGLVYLVIAAVFVALFYSD